MTKEQHDLVYRQHLILSNISDLSQARLNSHWQHAIYEGLDYLSPIEFKEILKCKWEERQLIINKRKDI